ncbi:MAG: carotenoid biosynthesis protein [Bacteroidales bacterium]
MQNVLKTIRSKNPVPIVIIYYLVGLAGMIIPVTHELFKDLTPFSLLLSIFLLYLYHDSFSTRFWLVSMLILVLGFLVEVAGVETGLLFGEYSYGDTLGPRLFHTPLMIGVNWLMLVYCSLYIVRKYIDTPYFRAIVAAALMVVYDFALEPSAIYLGMWSWPGGAVPLQNYLAWFIIAFLLNSLADHLDLPARKNKLALPLFFIQLVFFIALDLWFYISRIWELS